MSEWQQLSLGSLMEIIGGGTPKTSVSGYWGGDIPWLSVVDFNTGLKFVSSTEKTITQEGLNNSSTKLLNKGDIIISARGTVGVLAILDKPMTFNQSCYGIRSKKGISDTDYLYYLLTDTVRELTQISHGGVFDTITRATFDEIEVAVPPLPEQKVIASVLSSLDDKIDLLHRQNKTLEAMAETLFRQWFIEEAKEDWEDGTLDQLIDLKYGKALKQEDRSGSGYPVVASSGIVGFHNNYLVKGPSIVIGRKGTLGKVYFMEDNFYPIDTSYFIQTKTSGSNLIFEYYLLKSLDFANMNSDSAVPGLNRNIALGTQIQVPPEELILSFNGTAQPWFSKIHSNTKQIQTLEKLRDTLLPKLMSGEVRVQYQTEEVA